MKSVEWTLFEGQFDTLVKQILAYLCSKASIIAKSLLYEIVMNSFVLFFVALITVLQSCHPRHNCFLTQHTWNVFLSCIQMWNPLLGLPESNISSVPNPLSLEHFFCRELLGEASWHLVGKRRHRVRSSTGGEDERNGDRRDQIQKKNNRE